MNGYIFAALMYLADFGPGNGQPTFLMTAPQDATIQECHQMGHDILDSLHNNPGQIVRTVKKNAWWWTEIESVPISRDEWVVTCVSRKAANSHDKGQ